MEKMHEWQIIGDVVLRQPFSIIVVATDADAARAQGFDQVDAQNQEARTDGLRYSGVDIGAVALLQSDGLSGGSLPRLPKLGDVVIYYQSDDEAVRQGYPSLFGAGKTDSEERELIAKYGPQAAGANGHRDHPAIVTAVWGLDCVNLHVLFDASASEVRTSVMRLPDGPVRGASRSSGMGWRWPNGD